MTVEQFAAGKSVGDLNLLADKFETLADAKATAAKAATAKVAAKGTVAKAATAGTAGKTVASTGGMAAPSTIWAGKGMSLGLGWGLGAWGPFLLAIGIGAAGYGAYRFMKSRQAAEPDDLGFHDNP